MLTADLLRGTIRSGRLYLPPIKGKRRREMTTLAQSYCALLAVMQGVCRDEVVDALRSIELPSRDRVIGLGLQKLLLDRCEFLMPQGPDPRQVRVDLFRLAAQVRASLVDDEMMDRQALVRQVSDAHNISPEQLESLLYADLKGTHVLTRVAQDTPEQLIERYERAREQSVLLRATSVQVRFDSPSPDAMRALLRACKFRRLLWTVRRERSDSVDSQGTQWVLTIDGPMSLMRSSTRYGLQLALVLPAIRAMGRFELQAQVRWGRQRKEALWVFEGKGDSTMPSWRHPDDVARLMDDINGLDLSWTAQSADALLELPGIGWCVPDLTLMHPKYGQVYLEVMGHWSRDAVWRRIELVQRGLSVPILFALSDRLRVDASALEADQSGALVVYKGVIHARRVLDMAASVAERSSI